SLDHNWAVLEIGTNHPGEIEPLSRLASPDVALVTKVAPAHIEFFESVEKVAEEKLSIERGLREGGVLVLNANDEFMKAEAEKISPLRKITRFGSIESADVRLLKREVLEIINQKVTIASGSQESTATLSSFGQHGAM